MRATAFDKSANTNWSLGWHQDRTIALTGRQNIPGYGPWSVKQGIMHAEPPFKLLQRMRTLRLHFDAVPADNGPLKILRGSHLLGRLSADAIAPLSAGSDPYVCLAQAGDGWLYATPIVHASARSSGDGRRRVLQLDISPDVLPPPLSWASQLPN